ncbi:unnamed protein product [Protopolystoma xenopodis]|uniref:Uncharacterized protein n=1 Tax=Protopolystoma xenopodis TaxID=117903 RepID=A0A448XQQ9_9PLAT|nr:unnamed protein product [Protopolystoma xenopodis]
MLQEGFRLGYRRCFRLFIFINHSALNIHPGDLKALYRRAYAHYMLGNFKGALEDARKLIGLEPKNKAAQSLLRNIEAEASARIDPQIKLPVETILEQLFKITNSYRLTAQVRERVLECLVRIVPSERGIGWSRNFLKLEGSLERLLEVGTAAGVTALDDRRPVKSRTQKLLSDINEVEQLPLGFRLATTANTRTTLACLLAKLWDDLILDKERQQVISTIGDFLL